MKNAALTPTQQAAYDEMLSLYRDANEKTFEEWAAKYRGVSVGFLRRNYEDIRRGVLSVRFNTRTLKALESKGYIEIGSIGGDWLDRVKLLIF